MKYWFENTQVSKDQINPHIQGGQIFVYDPTYNISTGQNLIYKQVCTEVKSSDKYFSFYFNKIFSHIKKLEKPIIAPDKSFFFSFFFFSPNQKEHKYMN